MYSKETFRTVQSCLEEVATEKLRQCLQDLHPVDIAEVMPGINLAQRVKVLKVMDSDRAAMVIMELDRDFVPPLLEGLGRHRTAEILAEMFTDDAADLLGEMPGDKKELLLGLMQAADAKDVKELLEYGEETAGGIMTTEYVAIRQGITVEQAIQVLRKTAPDAETVYYVYVVNAENQLVGVISLRELIIAGPTTLIEDIMRTNFITVHVRTDQEEVAKLVAKYDFLAIPVVNDDRELLGIVTVDDVLDVIQEEATEDILRMTANIDGEARDLDAGPLRRAMLRLPWLLVLMCGSLLAGNVIEGFLGVLEQLAVLAIFITVLAGGPGNVATQSMAVVVRGLATGEVNSLSILSVVWKEVRVGFLLGAVCGLALAIIGFAWQGSPLLGLVVGLTLAINMVMATMLGSLFPLVINRLGIDPALASGPFITTVMDVTSMLIYFTLATIILLR
jgi:magnesium transporter